MRARRSAVAAIGAVAAISLCMGPAVAVAQDEPSAQAVRTVASKLDIPWDIEFVPDGSGLFTERDTKKIKKIKGTTITTVQTVSQVVLTGGEGGLLGLAVSKTFAADNTVYIYYSTASDNRIAKLKLGGQPQPIVTGIPKAKYHNGGGLEFGPDGFLYASTGDGQKPANAQSKTSLGGKILKFDTNGKAAPGNPFGTVVYSYGHRNPQGLAWANGRLYATEFGEGKTDELNWIQAGKNYGWPACEGPCSNPAYTNPAKSWDKNTCGPAGIAFYKGALYIGAVTGKRVWKIPVTGTILGNPQSVFTGYGRVRSVAPAPDGTLWLGTSNQDANGSPGAQDDRILSTDG